MRLGGVSEPLPSSPELASALRVAAEQLGHRPALTVLHPDGREEQGYASLAQWAAKGAHLLQLEALAAPGDRLLLAGPTGWLPVAVCLACWWVGVEVVTSPDTSRSPDVAVAVHHESVAAPDAPEVYVYGDAPDGGVLEPVGVEEYAVAVQAFPDQPPAPTARPEAAALRAGEAAWTQAALLDHALRWGEAGTLGFDATTTAPGDALVAAAVRPLVTGRPTVVLRGASRDDAAAERVDRWLT